MIDLATFEVEEYKVIQTRIDAYRDIVGRLETFTVGGTVVAISVLLGISNTNSNDALSHGAYIFAWWGLVAILAAATYRCWTIYLNMMDLQKYVLRIESRMKNAGYTLPGIETSGQTRFSRLWQMLLIWVVLNVVVVILAIVESW